MNVLLHPSTERNVSALQNALPHALLLTGAPGTGLSTIAGHIAGNDLVSLTVPLDSKQTADHETGTIAVATIRLLYEQTRAKYNNRQVYIIDDADRMSLGAQAAFLKLLEEPRPDTHFILTSHAPQLLLPTIRSRVQSVVVRPLEAQQTAALIDSYGEVTATKKKQLTYLAQGLPAELLRLLSDEAYFTTRAEVMSDTRTFLAGTLYERLLIVHKYQGSKQRALQLIQSALVVSKYSLQTNPTKKLVEQLEALVHTKEHLDANGNVRLQLMAFVVQ